MILSGFERVTSILVGFGMVGSAFSLYLISEQQVVFMVRMC